MRFIQGNEYHDLMLSFNQMRKKRHDFIYNSQNHTTVSEAKSAIKTAKEFIGKIVGLTTKERPGSLF
jgi:uncharacterized protein (UPF0332 family)